MIQICFSPVIPLSFQALISFRGEWSDPTLVVFVTHEKLRDLVTREQVTKASQLYQKP
jgi:hypothetical protein